MPTLCAQPNSRLIVAVSNVSACHISNWLTAVLGKKSAPTNQPCFLYHELACSFDHILGSCAVDTIETNKNRKMIFIFLMNCYDLLTLSVFLQAACPTIVSGLAKGGTSNIKVHTKHINPFCQIFVIVWRLSAIIELALCLYSFFYNVQ